MSMMCTKGTCQSKSGPCGHEKMMMVMVALIALGGLGHFALHLF